MVVNGYQFISLNHVGKVTAFSNIYPTLGEAKYIARSYTAREDICDSDLPYWFILGLYAIYDIEGTRLSEDRAAVFFQMLSDVMDFRFANSIATYHPIPYLYDQSPIPRFSTKFYVAVVQWPENGDNPMLLRGTEVLSWSDALKIARTMSVEKSGPGPVFKGIVQRNGIGSGVMGQVTVVSEEKVYDKRGKVNSADFEDSLRGVRCHPIMGEVVKKKCTCQLG